MSITRQINFPLLLICNALLAGCSSSAKYQISDPVTLTKSSFELIDARDKAQKKSKLLSVWATNCLYGIYRIGDEQIVPSRLTILSNALEESMSQQLQGKKVTIKRFEIFNNQQKPMRESAAASAEASADPDIGSISASIIRSACVDERSLENNPENDPAIVVLIDIDIDGVNIKDKTVQVEPAGEVNPYSKRDLILNERVKLAVFASIEKVVARALK